MFVDFQPPSHGSFLLIWQSLELLYALIYSFGFDVLHDLDNVLLNLLTFLAIQFLALLHQKGNLYLFLFDLGVKHFSHYPC